MDGGEKEGQGKAGQERSGSDVIAPRVFPSGSGTSRQCNVANQRGRRRRSRGRAKQLFSSPGLEREKRDASCGSSSRSLAAFAMLQGLLSSRGLGSGTLLSNIVLFSSREYADWPGCLVGQGSLDLLVVATHLFCFTTLGNPLFQTLKIHQQSP